MTETPSHPMVETDRLSKHYAGVVAVNDLSIRIDAGEIVGFLGPNGAGKTTTLRILSGFLSASGGRVRVAGFDVFTHSREVRRRIGYLPENCPLYLDMRVEEYLRYRASLKGVARHRVTEAVAVAAERCGLSDVRRRIIGQLSKGYRQRVGLADSIVHSPQLLILDEPTVGLDPNQVLQVRELIRELGRSMTILLSTHQLPEVEATCHRAILISQGRVVASDTLDGLRHRLGGGIRVRVEVEAAPGVARQWIAAHPDLTEQDVSTDGAWTRVELLTTTGADPRPALFDSARAAGLRLRELHWVPCSLEEAFVALTRPRREDAA
jgi:ABC-2 type transport system ATP-binding protein